MLGEECFVGAGAVITSDVKVYPFKTVEAGATVNTSIVWESRGARSLFGRTGVTGLANVDISPELVMRLSMAWAGTSGEGVDHHRFARHLQGVAGAQESGDGRLQLGRRERRRPRSGHGPRHPPPGPVGVLDRRSHRAARSPTTPSP